MEKKKIQVVIAASIAVLALIIAGAAGIFGGASSKKAADLYEVFGMKDEQGKNYDSDKAAIILNHEIEKEETALTEDGYYLPLTYVQQKLNERFYYDKNENVLLYTLPEGTQEYSVDDKNVKKVEGTIYVKTDLVGKYTNVTFETYQTPNRILIQSKWGDTVKKASVKKDTQIRLEGDKKSDITRQCKKGDEVLIEEDGKDWTKVSSKDGIPGYIKTDCLENQKEEKQSHEFQEQVYQGIPLDKKVSMAWHQVTTQEANANLNQAIASMQGVNVISPTWFALCDEKGSISSLASRQYVRTAHNKGLEVWALINDFSKDSDGKYYVNSVLTYTSKRKVLIDNLITKLKEYDIDGLNLDFEYVTSENGDDYIQFVRELSLACHENGIILSIDNYVSSEWTSHYNRKEQGVFADYVVVMGYDEHNTASNEAGSVASLTFEKKGIEDAISEVGDSSKVVSALPFYTRIWQEVEGEKGKKTDGKYIEDAANGDYYLSSKAVGMETAEKYFSQQNIKGDKVWLDDLGQYYQEGQLNDATTIRIWYEDEKSIEEKLKLIDKYKLGGAAYWKLGFEKDDIWKLIKKYLASEK